MPEACPRDVVLDGTGPEEPRTRDRLGPAGSTLPITHGASQPAATSDLGRRVDNVRDVVADDATEASRKESRTVTVAFDHIPHPRIAERRKAGPPKSADEHVGPNGRVALILTTAVGTMWCAYAFAILALIALPQALGGGLLALIQWVSQTFIQLVMLSVIMVGQNILSSAADKRADMTYRDAEATFHEAEQIQSHLKAQDDALNALLDKVQKLEATLGKE